MGIDNKQKEDVNEDVDVTGDIDMVSDVPTDDMEDTDVPPGPETQLTGYFLDSPVEGLRWTSENSHGNTNQLGAFGYDADGEMVLFSIGEVELGSAPGANLVTPYSFVPGAADDDPEVINRARIIQTLDKDGNPSNGILITGEVSRLLEDVIADMDLTAIDYGNTEQVDEIIAALVAGAADLEGHQLQAVDAQTAKDQLDSILVGNNDIRHNISNHPERFTDIEESTTPLIRQMEIYAPALDAQGNPTLVYVYDDDGNLTEVRDQARPIVMAYMEEMEGTETMWNETLGDVTNGMDFFVAISRDDGATWQRTNVSKMAEELALDFEGTTYPGTTVIGGLVTDDEKILLAFPSKLCKGGNPTYTIKTTDGRTTDDPYYEEDIWGVSGSQGRVDYTEDFPEVGLVPYSCVWTVRGTVGPEDGDISWYKPERLTSGRRDAFYVTPTSTQGAGFAIVWQEDPEGLG